VSTACATVFVGTLYPLALEALIEGRVNKIILIRSAVATRDIGFLPGTEAEKMAVYEQAFSSIVNELLGRGDAGSVPRFPHESELIRGISDARVHALGFECCQHVAHVANKNRRRHKPNPTTPKRTRRIAPYRLAAPESNPARGRNVAELIASNYVRLQPVTAPQVRGMGRSRESPMRYPF
jgi:hypothetical protein